MLIFVMYIDISILTDMSQLFLSLFKIDLSVKFVYVIDFFIGRIDISSLRPTLKPSSKTV